MKRGPRVLKQSSRMYAPRRTARTPSKNEGVGLRSKGEAPEVLDAAGQMRAERGEDGLTIEGVRMLRR